MNKKASIYVSLIAVLLFFAIGSTTLEGKDPVEISQKDIPLTITESGAYILESNLHVDEGGITAIQIAADNVDIDLHGFTIMGPGQGVGGTGFGINTSVNHNVVIRNGTVTEFGFVGVHLPGENNRVENVRAFRCGSDGIFSGRSSIVRNCQAAYCSGNGINVDDGSLVTDNTCFSNGANGIMTSGDAMPTELGGVTVRGNNCRLNGTGIYVKGEGCQIESNTVTKNGTGIDLTDGIDNYFAGNVIIGNVTALTSDGDDINGGNIVL